MIISKTKRNPLKSNRLVLLHLHLSRCGGPNQVVALSCWYTNTASSGPRTPLENFLAPDISSASKALRPQPLETGDFSRYIIDFSSGVDLVLCTLITYYHSQHFWEIKTKIKNKLTKFLIIYLNLPFQPK